ncbi:MAG TPA: DUF929 family protein [Acidimicrobiales bacterium]|nr:DUF929 family protein [Acidimicrobiales bacterium]
MCSDYLNASSSDRGAVLTQLAQEYRQPELVSPLGAPGVDYECVEYPNETLGQIAQSFGRTNPTAGASSSPSAPSEPNQSGIAGILDAVTNPSPSVVSAVGTGGQPGELTRLPGNSVLRASNGEPLVVWVAAEYCPFCAAERWVMVMWLSRFGTFTNLSEIQSSSTDIYPDTDGFTFYKSSYSSQYVAFSPNEIEDRNKQPLMSMSSQVSNIFATWDQPPYTIQSGQFPFLDIGGTFTLSTTSYTPNDLAGLSWSQIADDLSAPTSTVARDIIGNANILTAATCIVTRNQPSSVCASPTIQAIEPALEQLAPPSS